MMIKFPYGISDFYRVSSEGYFYVDRTQSIPLLEAAGDQLLFLRPRRFGKSLWLSLLENYYDVARAGDFERLFGQLAIGQQPTPSHNRYLVMTWDFSTVDAQGDGAHIRQALYNQLNGAIERFKVRYAAWLQHDIYLDEQDALRSFASLLTAVQATPYPLYLFIDEYDNFANQVLMAGQGDGHARYAELVQGEGIFKTVFKAIKTASRGQGLERVFITGVSPVVMADISSGYNVAKNIYLEPEFNHLCGFTEAEVTAVLQQVAAGCHFSAAQVTEALTMLRTLYNGYCFNPARYEPIYNPTLVLYFLGAFQKRCQYPEEMLDSNLAPDRNRLLYIARVQGAEALIAAALNEQTPLTVATLAQRFGVAEMVASEQNREALIALLYYLGVLTLTGRNELGEITLRIPNLVIRRLYAERLAELLLPSVRDQDAGHLAARALYQRGAIEPLCSFVEQKILRTLDNRAQGAPDLSANELTIKMVFLALLFEDHFFIVDSEPTLDRTYGDLLLLLRPDMRQYKLLDILIEFKYIKLNALGKNGLELRQMSTDEIKMLPAVQTKLTEAHTQLQTYRATLTQQYGAVLRLHTYAVVALGSSAWSGQR